MIWIILSIISALAAWQAARRSNRRLNQSFAVLADRLETEEIVARIQRQFPKRKRSLLKKGWKEREGGSGALIAPATVTRYGRTRLSPAMIAEGWRFYSQNGAMPCLILRSERMRRILTDSAA